MRLAWATELDSASKTKAKEPISTIIVTVPQWLPSCWRIPEKAASSSRSSTPLQGQKGRIRYYTWTQRLTLQTRKLPLVTRDVYRLSQSQMGDRDLQAN